MSTYNQPPAMKKAVSSGWTDMLLGAIGGLTEETVQVTPSVLVRDRLGQTVHGTTLTTARRLPPRKSLSTRTRSHSPVRIRSEKRALPSYGFMPNPSEDSFVGWGESSIGTWDEGGSDQNGQGETSTDSLLNQTLELPRSTSKPLQESLDEETDRVFNEQAGSGGNGEGRQCSKRSAEWIETEIIVGAGIEINMESVAEEKEDIYQTVELSPKGNNERAGPPSADKEERSCPNEDETAQTNAEETKRDIATGPIEETIEEEQQLAEEEEAVRIAAEVAKQKATTEAAKIATEEARMHAEAEAEAKQKAAEEAKEQAQEEEAIREAADRAKRKEEREEMVRIARAEAEAEAKQKGAEEKRQIAQEGEKAKIDSSKAKLKVGEENSTATKKRLQFSKERLWGRQLEMKVLQRALDRSFETKIAETSIVLIVGAQGVGKSRLVQDSLRGYRQKAFVLDGKLDPNHTNISRPYAAFLEVFAKLVEQILQHPDRDMYEANVRAAFGSEAFRVTSLIPAFESIIGEDILQENELHDRVNDRSSLNQIFRLLREMIKQISSSKRPTIMFLDDLNLGGTEAVELFRFLSGDTTMQNVTFIGTLQDSRDERIRDFENPTLVELSTLDKESTNGLIAGVLEKQTCSTEIFTDKLWQKTRGNCLFLEQFTHHLEQLKLLNFSSQNGCWEWTDSSINSFLKSTGDLRSIVSDRLDALPLAAREVIRCAAILGNKFYSDYLEEVLKADSHVDMEHLLKQDADDQKSYDLFEETIGLTAGRAELTFDVKSIVSALTKLSFFVRIEEGVYRFAHDEIHAAALEIIDQREEAHWRMGHLLQNIVGQQDSKSESWLFFSIVEQLNMGSECIVDDDERLELAALTLRAAYRVKRASAFYPAGDYAKQGLALLDTMDHKWEFSKNVLTKLIMIRAEMAMCCGQTDDCIQTTQEIIDRARAQDEIVPAYILRIRAYGQVALFAEAVDEGVEVLARLGESFPKKPNVGALKPRLAKGRRRGFGKDKADIDRLGPMRDQKMKMIMEILAHIVFYAVRGTEDTQKLVPFFFNRMYEITIEYGNCRESTVAFAGYGVLMAGVLQDFDEGHRYGRLAMTMALQSGHGGQYQARGSHMVFGFLHHLKEPITDTLPALMTGFKTGMATDETADAVNCLFVWCSHYLNAGLPLQPLIDKMSWSLSIMAELQRTRIWETTVPYAQLAHNLAGRSVNPSELNGEFMIWADLLEKVKKSDNINALRTMYAAAMEAAYWFGDYDIAEDKMDQLTGMKIGIGQSLTFNYRRELFFSGLVSLAIVKSSKGTMKLMWRASQSLAQLKAYHTQGSSDCEDMMLILDAEYSSYSSMWGRKNKIADMYERAIDVSTRIGSIQNIALSKELAGKFFLENGEQEKGRVILKQAYDAYIQWNALGKARHCRGMYPVLNG